MDFDPALNAHVLSNIKRRTAKSLRQIGKDRRGSVAIIFGIGFVPLILATGGIIDYGRAVEKRSAIQQALDLGVLAAASNGQESSAYLQNIVNANLRGTNISVSSATVAKVSGADGGVTYKGNATFSMDTNFLRVVGLSSIKLTARSEASLPAQVVNVQFTPTNTSGAFSKDIFVWTKNAEGVLTSRRTVLTYRYTSSNGSKITTPPVGSTISFTVPLYSSFGLGMVVYKDEQRYSGALINPSEMWSDAGNAASFLKMAGACSSSTGATYNWEDGGDTNFKDFVYTMKCATGVATGTVARLSK